MVSSAQVRSPYHQLAFHRIADGDAVRGRFHDGDEVSRTAGQNNAGNGRARRGKMIERLDLNPRMKASTFEGSRHVPDLSPSAGSKAFAGQFPFRCSLAQ